jgi:predicted nucleic acid-binding protein
VTQVVVDTSVVAKVFFAEDFSDLASALFHDAETSIHTILAPYLLAAEMVNVIRQRIRRERQSLQAAMVVLHDFLALPIEYSESPELYRQSLILTDRYGLSAFDAQYVALAQMVGCDLWVADRKALSALAGRLPFVKWIGDYPMTDAEST